MLCMKITHAKLKHMYIITLTCMVSGRSYIKKFYHENFSYEIFFNTKILRSIFVIKIILRLPKIDENGKGSFVLSRIM